MEPSIWPINLLDKGIATYHEGYKLYRQELIALLKSNFGYDDLLNTYTAFALFDALSEKLYSVKRYANYQVADTGDMNVSLHTLRQTLITVHALLADREQLALSHAEIDAMITASFIHDLGELALTDISYDIKEANKKDREIDEGEEAFKLMRNLDHEVILEFKEIYLHITTTLEEDEVYEFLKTSKGESKIRWHILKNLFNAYERYGYQITGFQVWPFKDAQDYERLSDLDIMRLNEWNRAELEVALANGEEVSEEIKNAVVYKNVILNQWSLLQNIAKEYPSTKVFFGHPIVKEKVAIANKMLGIDVKYL